MSQSELKDIAQRLTDIDGASYTSILHRVRWVYMRRASGLPPGPPLENWLDPLVEQFDTWGKARPFFDIVTNNRRVATAKRTQDTEARTKTRQYHRDYQRRRRLEKRHGPIQLNQRVVLVTIRPEYGLPESQNMWVGEVIQHADNANRKWVKFDAHATPVLVRVTDLLADTAARE